MSWHYLRERGAVFSLPDYLDGLQSQRSRSKSTAARSCLLVSPKDISSNSRSGTTSRPSTGDLFADLLTSLPAGSPARTSVQLVVEWALPASVAACGLSISDLLRRLGLGLYSPKTSRRSVPVALAPSYQDLPNWGMTYDGVCWELGMSVRPIDVTECGSSLCGGRNHHVPTPTASDHIERVSTSTEKLNFETNKSVSLDRWVGMWPTPGAQESNPTQEFIDEAKENQKGTHERLYLPGRKHHTQRTLSRAIHLWPTPTSSVDSGSRNTPGSKAHPGTSLTDAVRGDGGTGRLWPTPKSGKSGPDLGRQDRENSGGDDLLTAVTRRKWPTPGAQDAKWRDTPHTAQLRKEKGGQLGLHAAVILEGQEQFPTPRASEWKGTGPLGSKSHEYRLERGYLDATIQEREQTTGPLNPTWVEWLMGWPTGWTDLKQLGTDKFRWWQHKHGLF
jgi:hypothetical protein